MHEEKKLNANTNNIMCLLYVSSVFILIFALFTGIPLLRGGLALFKVTKLGGLLLLLILTTALLISKNRRIMFIGYILLLYAMYNLLYSSYSLVNGGLTELLNAGTAFSNIGGIFWAGGLLLTFLYIVKKKDRLRASARKLIIISILFNLVSAVYTYVISFIENGFVLNEIYTLLLNIIASAFLLQWLFATVLLSEIRSNAFFFAYPTRYKKDKSVYEPPQVDTAFKTQSVPLAIFLFIITLGFYNLYFIYKTTDALRYYSNSDAKRPGVSLALAIFIPFYIIYWYVKTSREINETAQKLNTSSMSVKRGTAFFMCILCMPLLMGIFMGKINAFIEADMAKKGVGLIKRRSYTLKELSSVRFIFYYIMTFGIYGLYFLYTSNVFLDAALKRKNKNAGRKVLLCMIIPFYRIYLEVATAKHMEKLLLSWTDKEIKISKKVFLFNILLLNIISGYIMRKSMSIIVDINYSHINCSLPDFTYKLAYVKCPEISPFSKTDTDKKLTVTTATVIAAITVVVGMGTSIINQIHIGSTVTEYINSGQYYLAEAYLKGAPPDTKSWIEKQLYSVYVEKAETALTEKDTITASKMANRLSNLDLNKSKDIRYRNIGLLIDNDDLKDAFSEYLNLSENETNPYKDEVTLLNDAFLDDIKSYIKVSDIDKAKEIAAIVKDSRELGSIYDFVKPYEEFFTVYNGGEWGSAIERLSNLPDKSIVIAKKTQLEDMQNYFGSFEYSFESKRTGNVKVNVKLTFNFASSGNFSLIESYVKSSIKNPTDDDYVTKTLQDGNWRKDGAKVDLYIDGELKASIQAYVVGGLKVVLDQEFFNLINTSDIRTLTGQESILFLKKS
ncbi:MAG: DUF4234 domain-containing protein [Eubacteriales bacterium]